MARTEEVQLNIRSRFARERSAMLARQTGLTTTQVIEEALRAYAPPASEKVMGRLVRRGPVLVRPADNGRVTLEAANEALDASRIERD